VDETIHKLVQRGRKGDGHRSIVVRGRILSRSGRRWFHDRSRCQSSHFSFDGP
jgi:hypothetical protein